MNAINRTLASAPPAASAEAPVLRLAELLGALSHALDLTEGQPAGHAMRCCWIGVAVGRAAGLREEAIADLFYVLLLKDLGCSSNAARICRMFATDDIAFKRGVKLVGPDASAAMRFALSRTGLTASFAGRFRALVRVALEGGEVAGELIETRCERGAAIARKMRFSDAVAAGIRDLDEHWDGNGRPLGIMGEGISPFGRIALLAQVIDVFHAEGGAAPAIAEVRARAGTWFDPRMVAAFERVACEASFWSTLATDPIEPALFGVEPARHMATVDDDYLDDVAAAFAQVVDAKSPFTAGHSDRVTDYADRIAGELGIPSLRRRWLRRAALLHDIGKLGVSNSILDKPGPLDPGEWAIMRRHSAWSETILSRIGAFGELARVAGAHHERLDGGGYPNGIGEDTVGLETRIISAADVFDALTADRPYRKAMPSTVALDVMRRDAGRAFDPACIDALAAVVSRERAALAD